LRIISKNVLVIDPVVVYFSILQLVHFIILCCYAVYGVWERCLGCKKQFQKFVYEDWPNLG